MLRRIRCLAPLERRAWARVPVRKGWVSGCDDECVYVYVRVCVYASRAFERVTDCLKGEGVPRDLGGRGVSRDLGGAMSVR